MSRMEGFEKLWAIRHDVPAESLVQYRFESRDGYRLPDMAAHYRTYCDTLDSVVIELPADHDIQTFSESGITVLDSGFSEFQVRKMIESAGLKAAQ